MTDTQWHTAWKPAFDDIVARGPKPHEAVADILAFAEQQRLVTPPFYVSTAISSAGWRRHPDFSSPEQIPAAIEHNNRTASRVLDELITSTNSFVDDQSMMVPTDLGKVPGWKDTDYLQFYFAWLGGLNAAGAQHFTRSFADDQYSHIFHGANDRTQTNEQRWPWYQLFTEVALTKLRLTESRPNTHTGEESQTLLQLIDVNESLGCRAERLFADARDLDIIIPTFGDQLPGELQSDVEKLRAIGASVGAPRTPVELIPVSLR